MSACVCLTMSFLTLPLRDQIYPQCGKECSVGFQSAQDFVEAAKITCLGINISVNPLSTVQFLASHLSQGPMRSTSV